MSNDALPAATPPPCPACGAGLRVDWLEAHAARINGDALIASTVGVVGLCTSCGQKWFRPYPDCPAPSLDLV